LAGKKIGIIGFGKVGSKVGKLSRAFGMEVYANDINSKVRMKNTSFEFRSLKFILQNCEIISIHIPLNKKNVHFFSRKRLELINRDCILINTSRGDVIEEDALLKLLEDGKIKFAGIDVFSSEPDINERFLKLKNVLLTNHIAGKTQESRKRISEEIFLKLSRIYKGLSAN